MSTVLFIKFEAIDDEGKLAAVITANAENISLLEE